METNEKFNSRAIPLRWGLIIGIISVFTFTIYSMFLMQNMGMMGGTIFGVFSFLLMMILLGVMGTQQRKAMGGYITLREAFSAIFLSILIVVLISQAYSFIYTNWIDPEYYEKMKEMSMQFTYKLGGEEAVEKAEESYMQQNPRSFKTIFMGIAGSLVMYSLFGFIVAAIVKRKKPEHLA